MKTQKRTNDFSLKNEEWRPLPGLERYEISNIGRVKYLKTGNILSHSFTKNGKHILGLVVNGVNQKIKHGKISIRQKIRTFEVGYLVALAFKKESHLNEKYVRYVDGNYDNLKHSNLKWAEIRESRKA